MEGFHSRVLTLMLFLIVAWVAGCGQTKSPPALATASSTLTSTLRPIPESQGWVLPDWIEIRSPPGCDFGELSRSSQWLTYYCSKPQKMPEGWLAQVNVGQLENLKPLNDMRSLGFTLDGSGLIVKRKDNTWWLMHLPDFTQQPYFPGLDDDAYPGWVVIWSPNHSMAAIDDAWRNIFVLSPQDRTLEQVVKAPVQNGTQFSWSPDSQEIAYVEGFPTVGDGTMVVRVVNVRSRQSRILLESKLSVSGASWSPDKKWIAIRAEDWTQNKTHLWLMDPNRGHVIEFEYNWLGADALDGWKDLMWSPDGSKLVLRVWRTKPISESGILIVEVPSGRVVQQFLTGYMEPLGWSIDSASLVVRMYEQEEDRSILRWISVQP